MNKRNADKEKVELMKWINALKVHDPMRNVDRIQADSCQPMHLSDSQLRKEDLKVGLACAGYQANADRIKAMKVIVSVFIERMMRQ